MARKKQSNVGLIGSILVAALVVLSAVPAKVWIGIAIFIAVCFVIYLYQQSKKSIKQSAAIATPHAAPHPQRFDGALTITVDRLQLPAHQRDVMLPGSVGGPPSAANGGFAIPPAPSQFGPAQWIAAQDSFELGGTTINGGMVYLGTSHKTARGSTDPCIIDPSKSVASTGDFTEGQLGYWPSYSDIAPGARRAYLNWLSTGRNHPDADIGYVFLFFYGLERRAIVDAATDPAARSDWSLIAAELRTLLRIYGDKSHSFRGYASELLNWVSIAHHPEKLYLQAVPPLEKTFELPLYLRLALGQASVDGIAVPTHLALAWAKLDPSSSLRTPALRCSEMFDKLFQRKYFEAVGEGIVFPRNRTKLKFVYRPASSALHGTNQLVMSFGDTPDVTVLTGPITKLHEVVADTTKALEPYSRFLGRNPEAAGALEALLQLPAILWPEKAQIALNALRERMGAGMVSMPFQELLSSLGASSTLTRDKTLALARALETIGIGMEPDALSGAKLPKTSEKVVLFALSPNEDTARTTVSYQAAALTLQLASAVATADGDFSSEEVRHLRELVQSWTHLSGNHTRRLLAHLRLLIFAPVSLASLKQKLAPLDSAAKEAIAAFMAKLAQSDGVVSPKEVQVLERVYKALGVDPKKVFSNVHAVATGGSLPTSAASIKQAPSFALDAARIAALQQDTEKVSAMLANIFQEEDLAAAATEETPEDEENVAQSPSILGLDEAHATLARMLLSRPQWTRSELRDVVGDLDLMLDGALEHINEAAFDLHDAALIEGEDPVIINRDVLEKIEA